MIQTELMTQIEALFAGATPENLRDTSRRLERLVRQIDEKAVRARYEAAIDLLPDIVAHTDLGHGG